MSKLENPVLKREFRLRLRIRKIISAIILRLGFLGFFFLLIFLSRIGKGLLALILSEALLLLIFSPGSIFTAFSGDSNRRDFLNLSLTRISSWSIFLGKFVGANFYNFLIIFISAMIMFLSALFHKNLHILPLMFSHLALVIIAFTSSAISLTFSILFHRNSFTSAFITYIIIFLLIGSVVIPGPVITRIYNHEVKSLIANVALYINPLIMTSRSLGNIDIMRTQYLYQIADPIVAPGFTYPDWRYAALLYSGVSCFILMLSFLVFRNLPDWKLSTTTLTSGP
jgi:hypothetical protein